MEKEEYVFIKKDHLNTIIAELVKMPMQNVEGIVNFFRHTMSNTNIEAINKEKELEPTDDE